MRRGRRPQEQQFEGAMDERTLGGGRRGRVGEALDAGEAERQRARQNDSTRDGDRLVGAVQSRCGDRGTHIQSHLTPGV